MKTNENHLCRRLQSFHFSHLELIHDLADALAASSDDASVDPAVQRDVLRHHLLQLIYNGLDGVSCCYGFVLIPCNGYLILEDDKETSKNNDSTSSESLLLKY